MDVRRRDSVPAASDAAPLRLGGLAIDPVSREVRRDGFAERLRPQDLKVLLLLAERRGRLVSRQALVDRCWDGRIVGDDVINHSISMLRKLAARAGGFAIETVPRAGYRLVEHGRPPDARRRGWLVALVVALAGGLLLALGPWRSDPDLPRIAVLPPVAAPGDRGVVALGQAIREAVAAKLGEGDYPVLWLDSADPRRADLFTRISLRQGPGGVAVQVRVEEATQRAILFSRDFEAATNQAAGLPDRISAALAAALSWTVPHMVLDRRQQPVDPALTAKLLRLLALSVDGSDNLRAYNIAREVVAEAPNSAVAQISLAFNSAFAASELPVDQRAAVLAGGRRALARAERLAPGFGDLGGAWCWLHPGYRFAECEQRLRRGMAFDPDAPFAGFFLSRLMHRVGREEEALYLAREARADDRYKPAKIAQLLWLLEAHGRIQEADALWAEAQRYFPGHPGFAYQRWMGVAGRGDLARLERLSGPPIALDSALAQAAFAAARSGDGAAALRACPERVAPEYQAILCLVVLARLDERDRAFALATRMFPAFALMDPAAADQAWARWDASYPTTLLVGPALAPLRADPRFDRLARGTGQWRYWQAVARPDFCRPPGEPLCRRLDSPAN